ncbi:Chaperone protein dnaJ 11, chloroplastic [Linum grandiflorum]
MAFTSSFLCSSPSSALIAPNRASSFPAPSRVGFRSLRVTASCASTAERGTSTLKAGPRRSSLYEVLGIQTGATCQEIKAAYRRMARVLHPDVAGEDDGTASEFIKLHEAYETLSDPEKRADYDRTLFRVGRSMSYAFVMSAASGSGLSGYTSRRWETDQCW